MARNIIKLLTYNLRKNKNSKGFIVDFMYFEEDNNKIPYVNIYYFNGPGKLHKHYIITIEGQLEIAHNNYEKEWDNNPGMMYFDRIYPSYSNLFPSLILNHCLYNRIIMPIETKKHSFNGMDILFDLCDKYMFLARCALSDFIDEEKAFDPFLSILNILKNAEEYNICLSDMKKKKKSIIKHKQKRLIIDNMID